MCQHVLLLRRYLMCVCVCVCLFMDIVRNQWMCIGDKLEPSTSLLLQHKICIDLFCCSWNLSLPLDVIASIELTVCSAHFLVLFFFDFIEHERVELVVSFFSGQTLSKQKGRRRGGEAFEEVYCISYSFRWIIILLIFEVFVESCIISNVFSSLTVAIIFFFESLRLPRRIGFYARTGRSIYLFNCTEMNTHHTKVDSRDGGVWLKGRTRRRKTNR